MLHMMCECLAGSDAYRTYGLSLMKHYIMWALKGNSAGVGFGGHLLC